MANSRYLSQSALKKLFALSRNICAFPECELELSRPEWPKVRARVCHICGLNEGAARFDKTVAVRDRNAYENLLLLCPNHHDLIDELEPGRFSVDDLLDMKHAHEHQRPGDIEWCTEAMAEELAVKLARTVGLELRVSAQEPRDPIRSGTPHPTVSRQPRRPNWANQVGHAQEAQWPRGPRRVRDLAAELGMTQASVLELCSDLGIPARTKDRTLSEPYADMVRRRARRDGY